ncbi:MAG: RibD family protein, partial [Rhodospirillaceae bacterium]
MNAGFFARVDRGRPFVTLKLATTLDGRIATRSGHSQWITGQAARRRGHLLRAAHDAILTGIGTVLADDPQLTCRIAGLEDRSPVRVVLDSQRRMPEAAAVAPAWRYHAAGADGGASEGVEDIAVAADADGRADIVAVLVDLAGRGITRLLVEAGPTVTTRFLADGLADAVAWFRAPAVMGGDGRAAVGGFGVDDLADMAGFVRIETLAVGADALEIYRRRADA